MRGESSPAAFRKQVCHRQSSPPPPAGIGRRNSSSAHQHLPTVLPHSNAAPQRVQDRRRGSALAGVLMRRLWTSGRPVGNGHRGTTREAPHFHGGADEVATGLTKSREAKSTCPHV